jgi:tetratricopeptide (TPR) repeat protein
MKMIGYIPFAWMAIVLCAGCGRSRDDFQASLAAGKAAYAAGDYRTAAHRLEASVRVCATNLEAQVMRALTAIAMGDMTLAQQAAEAARACDPASAEAFLLEGDVSWHAKDFARAKAAYGAVAEARDVPAALRSQAYASRAVVELAENAFDAARISLWRALRLNRRNAAAWYHLGVLSRDTWKFDEAALLQFDMAARLLPPDSAEPPDPREPFTLTVVRSQFDETLTDCHWISIKREDTLRGVSQIRTGIAKKRTVVGII